MELEISINKFDYQTPENIQKLLTLEGIVKKFEHYYIEIETLEDLDKVIRNIWKVFGAVDVKIQTDPLELFIDW